MSAKITGYPTSEPVTPPKGAAVGGGVADKQANEAPGAASQSGDQVTLTASARSLQKLSDAVAAAPVVDSAKVASVKQAIASGSYQVNPSRVAGKLLELDGKLK